MRLKRDSTKESGGREGGNGSGRGSTADTTRKPGKQERKCLKEERKCLAAITLAISETSSSAPEEWEEGDRC